MEGGIVGHRAENVVNHRVIKKRKIKRKEKRSVRISMVLQELYACSKNVFHSLDGDSRPSPPTPDHVQALCRILDGMKPEDVGLSKNLRFSTIGNTVDGSPRVIVSTIYACRKFSLALFFLPPTAVIPLHNHPGMTVFSKLLFGTMHLKSYDWAGSVDMKESKKPSNFKLARKKTDTDITAPCNTSVLFPTSGGNIHSLTAVTHCLVLDVIGPPYSIPDGRECSYYKDFPYDPTTDGKVIKAEEGESYAWLEEVEVDEASLMEGIPYLGPQFVVSE